MRLSTSQRQPAPPPIPARSPEEEAAIREHHEDEYRTGLDSVDDDEHDRTLADDERDDSPAMQAARLFAAGIATACTLGDVA